MRRNYLTPVNNQAGFTLVELMVVVAIIGILSAIAIPNFQKFQAKARQTEAKVALASAYTAQKSFAIEQTSYTGCLSGIGIATEGVKKFYSVGWSAAGDGLFCGRATQTCAAMAWPVFANNTLAPEVQCPTLASGDEHIPIVANNAINGAAVLSSELGAPAIAKDSFTIYAAGKISTTPTAIDKWSIDHNKNLINTQSGL